MLYDMAEQTYLYRVSLPDPRYCIAHGGNSPAERPEVMKMRYRLKHTLLYQINKNKSIDTALLKSREFILFLVIIASPYMYLTINQVVFFHFMNNLRNTVPVAERYIRSHLTYAAGREDIFTGKAFDEVHKESTGIPRSINRIAEKSLMYASQQNKRLIDE